MGVKWAQDAAYSLLMTQMDFSGALDSDCPEIKQRRLASDFAYGYAFGFADTLLHRAGLSDETLVAASNSVVFIRIFGAERGPGIYRQCVALQEHPEFVSARELAAREVRAWTETPDKSFPMGLADFLRQTDR
jgi:hypothetical protein